MLYRRYLKLLATLVAVLMHSLSYAAQSIDNNDLYVFIRADNPDKIEKFLNAGTDTIPVGADGDPLLVRAIREDAPRVVEKLLKSARIDINQTSRQGETALMLAAYKGRRNWVEQLLARGATVQHDGWTALHYACAQGYLDIAQLLVAKGALVDSRAPNGTTPMMMAARGGHVAVVRWLLEQDARVYLHNELDMNAADFAHEGGHKSLEKALRERIERAK